MALDKQRILHELGSVVNQLQSADCGCIGKLFSSSNQPNTAGSPLPMTSPSYGGCRHNCHNHNHGYSSAAGDSYGQMQAMNPMNQQPMAMNQMTPMNQQPMNQMPCMGRCNPPKMYADTYGYLNQNLMQPIVKEVYDDLKSITPANTMANNNALAGQMGLSAQGSSGGGANATMGGMAQYGPNNGLQGMGQNQQTCEGTNANYYQGNMGNQQQQQMSQMAGMGPDIVKMIMGDSKPNNAGQPFKLTEPMVLDAPQSPHGKIGVSPLNANKGQYGMMQAMPQTQMNQEQNSTNANQIMQMQQPNMNTQLNKGGHHNMYGQHTQGVKKFNEMFPGVMQGLGGDNLGFDPMAIAIQMNPANQHKNAVDTMTKMLMGQEGVKSGMNAVRQNVVPPAETASSIHAQATNKPNEFQSTAGLQEQNQNQQPGAMTLKQQQQVYTATGQPTFVTQDGDLIANTNVEVVQQQPEAQGDQLMNQAMKEPILPADTARNQAQKHYEYNTLGQPVELLPADCYKQQPLNLPQTLSPQPVTMRSNVKNTVSKTSLMGNRQVGKTPSRSQLQQIYHQYKGSQSNTQQNIRQTQGGSHSEGKLNTKLERVLESTVEKVGGDSAANNNQARRVETAKGQAGDVPTASKPHGDTAPANAPVTGKGRNGLQDMVFTSYPTSTAWSFHGDRTSSPFAHRYNNMNQQRKYRNVA